MYYIYNTTSHCFSQANEMVETDTTTNTYNINKMISN